MDKEDVTYTSTVEYYSAMRKEDVLPFLTPWIDPEHIMISVISQTKKNKCCTISLICRI